MFNVAGEGSQQKIIVWIMKKSVKRMVLSDTITDSYNTEVSTDGIITDRGEQTKPRKIGSNTHIYSSPNDQDRSRKAEGPCKATRVDSVITDTTDYIR